uniref:Uncharacterized protein n=1 Tax=Panagrolaimus sp. JU765 TaxID=591449 RepID=A0AC34R229_9BILA
MVMCYVKTKNVDGGDIAFTNERGCTDKLNGNLENVLTCNTSLCNSFKDYPIVDLEKDTNICYKTFDENLMYTKHRDCALSDKPYDEENMTMTCSTSRCNSLKDLPVNKTFFACYENDADGNFTVQTCSANECYVKMKNVDGDEVTFTADRGCIDKYNESMDNVLTCDTFLCNSFNDYPILDLEKDTDVCYKTFDGNLMYTKHRDCALSDKPFDEEKMTMTCSTSRCNSLKDLPVHKTFFACYENDADGNFTLQTCSDDDVGCFVKVSENKDEFYVYTAERGCANNTLVDENMIRVCNSSLCNSPGHDQQFSLDGKVMSCFVSNGQEIKHELCKLDAVGCRVEIEYLNDRPVEAEVYSQNRGCAYDDTSYNRERITCKSPRCNSVDKYGPSENAFFCAFPGRERGQKIYYACIDKLCYIKTAESPSHEKVLLEERGCAEELHLEMKDVLLCRSYLCNSFYLSPVFNLESNDTVICTKTDDENAFFVNCPIVPDKPSCSYAKDAHYYGGYHRDCYEHSSKMFNCTETKCNSVEKIPNILRCVDNDNKPILCEPDEECVVVLGDVKQRGCASDSFVDPEKNGILKCKGDLCNSKENMP